MKTELRCRPHGVIPGAMIFEVWYGDEFIGQVTGTDGPGVRVISKYELNARIDLQMQGANVAEIHIKAVSKKEYPSFLDFVQGHGFRDVEDFNILMAALPLHNHHVRVSFEFWKRDDGTKDGLLKIYNNFGIPLPDDSTTGSPGTGDGPKPDGQAL